MALSADAGSPTAPRAGAPTLTAFTKVAIVAVAAYAGAQVIADVSSLKIGLVAGRAVDMGTFIYPITFTLRDVVHKVLGRSAARTLIVTCGGVNLFMGAYIAWSAGVASDPAWGLDAEYSALLGPIWRIVIASIIAEVVSELVDTEVYHWFGTRVSTRPQWARVLASNAISVPLDSILFSVLAFGALPLLGDHALTLPWSAVWQIVIVNITVKGLVTLASMPLIYVAPDRDWSQMD